MRGGGATAMRAEARRRSRWVEWHMGEATWIWREREIGDQILDAHHSRYLDMCGSVGSYCLMVDMHVISSVSVPYRYSELLETGNLIVYRKCLGLQHNGSTSWRQRPVASVRPSKDAGSIGHGRCGKANL